MTSSYEMAKLLSNIGIHTFFRDVEVIGTENIPTTGPLIIYGNHNNQFADALLMVTKVQRKICFLAAQKSMHRPFIGHFCRAFDAIPVKRAMDLLKPGSGKIRKLQNRVIRGQNTFFQRQLQEGGMIRVATIEKEFTIHRIISNIQLEVKEQVGQYARQACSLDYKHSPKIEFSQLYESVWSALSRNQCIGIFPEGGSHDRLQFLPFKAGIVIMALGASQRYPGLNPVLLPCGFNYFNQDKFRSKVVIEFGQPFSLTQVFLQLYKKDRRTAISESLAMVERRLKDVTLHAPSFDFLKTLFLLRSLYIPTEMILPTKNKLQIVRSFAQTYQKHKENRYVNAVFQKATEYRQNLQSLGIIDKSYRMPHGTFRRVLSMLWSLIRLLLCLGLSLPGAILFSPIIILIRRLSQRQRLRCLRQSKVKLQARDIVASYKMLLGAILLPIYSILASIVLYLILQHYDYPSRTIASLSCIFFWMIYAPIAIRSFDGVLSHLKLFKSKFAALFNPGSYDMLMRMREQLKQEILKVVNDHLAPGIEQQIGGSGSLMTGIGEIDLDEVFKELTDLQNI